MYRIRTLFAIVLLLPFCAVQAHGQACGNRALILERLSKKFNEHPAFVGITAAGNLVEVLTSSKGTWTIIVTIPGGPTCFVGNGDGWRSAPDNHEEDPKA